jgi:hypothetical protein
LPTAPETFFESLDGARRLRVVTRSRRQLAVAHRSQLAAERLLRDDDRELIPDPLAKIDDPPTDYAMHRRDRTVLHHRCKRGSVFVVQT